MDNFAFTKFDADKFRTSLMKYEGLPNCLFVVAPDVPFHAKATMKLFETWREEIKRYGYPIALAAQDGLESISFRWDAFDAVFVGGTNKFKGSQFVQELVFEARMRGKWTHMGRVNSIPRWNYCVNARFDSVDGTGYVIERRRVKEALAVIEYPPKPTWELRPSSNKEVLWV